MYEKNDHNHSGSTRGRHGLARRGQHQHRDRLPGAQAAGDLRPSPRGGGSGPRLRAAASMPCPAARLLRAGAAGDPGATGVLRAPARLPAAAGGLCASAALLRAPACLASRAWSRTGLCLWSPWEVVLSNQISRTPGRKRSGVLSSTPRFLNSIAAQVENQRNGRPPVGAMRWRWPYSGGTALGASKRSQLAWPISTPLITRSMATQKVGVMGSLSHTQAQLIVLSGMRLLKSSTWLAGQ